MKSVLAFLAIAFLCLNANAQDVVTNETIVRLMQSNIPAATIIRTIEASPTVVFRFSPEDLQQLAAARVPEDVIRAMALKSNNSAPTAQRSSIPSSVGADRSSSLEGLDPWRVEIRALAGVNAGPNRADWDLPKTGLSGGLEFGARIKGPWSAIGRYVFNGMGQGNAVVCTTGNPCYLVPFTSKQQEVMGGIKLTAPTRVSPYIQVAAGLVHGSASTATRVGYANLGASLSVNRFGIAPGGGVDFLLGNHAGVGIDLTYLKLKDAGWLGRGALAVFFRF